MTETKRCPRCGQTKPVSEWHKNKASRDGLQAYCKPCLRAYRRQRMADSDRREHYNEQQRAWRRQRKAADPGYRERQNVRQRARRARRRAHIGGTPAASHDAPF